jgi:N-acetylglutamate synthase-like GNAT family acetyltransferase
MAYLPNIYFATERKTRLAGALRRFAGVARLANMALLPAVLQMKLGWMAAANLNFLIYRATEAQIETAYAIVQEYYTAASVVVRESREEFREQYFADGAGVWLVEADGVVVGCVALRKLPSLSHAGEIKRMYVRQSFRGQGVADMLLEALEKYAGEFGFEWLYLDTAADMKAAARFYARKGFQRCESYNQNPQAALFMRKEITCSRR